MATSQRAHEDERVQVCRHAAREARSEAHDGAREPFHDGHARVQGAVSRMNLEATTNTSHNKRQRNRQTRKTNLSQNTESNPSHTSHRLQNYVVNLVMD